MSKNQTPAKRQESKIDGRDRAGRGEEFQVQGHSHGHIDYGDHLGELPSLLTNIGLIMLGISGRNWSA